MDVRVGVRAVALFAAAILWFAAVAWLASARAPSPWPKRGQELTFSMFGEAFVFNATRRPKLVAFQTGASESVVVLLGGLTDGILTAPYAQPLSAELNRAGWALVQPLLSSALLSWGRFTLDDDAAELDELLAFLTAERGVRRVVLMGKSSARRLCTRAAPADATRPPAATPA